MGMSGTARDVGDTLEEFVKAIVNDEVGVNVGSKRKRFEEALQAFVDGRSDERAREDAERRRRQGFS
jgi:hypothetical protein